MSLLLDGDALAARRAIAAGPLAPLARSLAADLEPLLGREPYVPAEKALLSRAGGRCPTDGTLLDFDPWSPHEHRCPRCGQRVRGAFHDRFWIYWYQLWLAERAVHGAALHALGAGAACRELAASILDAYAERYASYPNRDNVLGPTRLFFSTYLESIWLLQLGVAVDLLEQCGERALAGRVRDRVVEPSAAIIAGYDEGASNRQVWNNAALLAAARLLDRPDEAERVVFGPSGLVAHLRDGLLADGSWYEGENYHLFAHRGLWYGVELASVAGLALPADLLTRFDEAFATPFVTALPDMTFPARRDSQYAVSLRQWRFAELCELGLARHDDARLAGALARLYGDDVSRTDTTRARSTAEAERNGPATALSRADLGWRSLLFARAELPPLEPLPPRSALLPAQGLAIFRRDGGRGYAALDYGHSGGGHGHPDRLNVLLAHGDARWLDDVGTGAYVDPSLHWYRSTLAHNAPLVGGRSQAMVHGRLLAHEERGAAGWVRAEADIAPAVVARRTIVVMPDYLVDVLEWESSPSTGAVTLDLPLHVEGAVDGIGAFERSPLAGSTALEDGYRFLGDTAHAPMDVDRPAVLRATQRGSALAAWCVVAQPGEWWRAVAPGPPGQGDRAFQLLRASSATGRFCIVWDWSTAIASVAVEGQAITIALADGTRHVHALVTHGWHVDLLAGGARSSIDLGGLVAGVGQRDRDSAPAEPAREPLELVEGLPRRFALGEDDYRRSEESWREAGAPAADVEVEWRGDVLAVRITVQHSERTFVSAGAENPYDNEHADVNGDGVQLYVMAPRGRGGWMLVPESGGGTVRGRPIDGWAGDLIAAARWQATADGYTLDCRIPAVATGGELVELGVIVNEMPRGRERRRGQLVFGGAPGEFVYLRGDRIEPAHLVPVRLVR